MAQTEQELRTRLFDVDTLVDEARANGDAVRLAELASIREELADELRGLLPEDAELGVQQNPDRRLDMIDIDQVPVPIVGPGGGVA